MYKKTHRSTQKLDRRKAKSWQRQPPVPESLAPTITLALGQCMAELSSTSKQVGAKSMQLHGGLPRTPDTCNSSDGNSRRRYCMTFSSEYTCSFSSRLLLLSVQRYIADNWTDSHLNHSQPISLLFTGLLLHFHWITSQQETTVFLSLHLFLTWPPPSVFRCR